MPTDESQITNDERKHNLKWKKKENKKYPYKKRRLIMTNNWHKLKWKVIDLDSGKTLDTFRQKIVADEFRKKKAYLLPGHEIVDQPI